MKTFRIRADATFEAETIDDAFAKMIAYFLARAMHDERVTSTAPFFGRIEIAPIDVLPNPAPMVRITVVGVGPGGSVVLRPELVVDGKTTPVLPDLERGLRAGDVLLVHLPPGEPHNADGTIAA